MQLHVVSGTRIPELIMTSNRVLYHSKARHALSLEMLVEEMSLGRVSCLTHLGNSG